MTPTTPPADDGTGLFPPSTYGRSFADVYDDWYHDISDAEATARFVAKRNGIGPVAELGVGTGRLVPALVEAGLNVIGFDASPEMMAKCPPSEGLSLVQSDLAALPLGEGRRGLGSALCAFNTLFNLGSVDLQQQLFNTVASALHPEGTLIIEAITGIGLAEGARDSLGVSRIDPDRLVLAATQVDGDAQTIVGQHVDISEAGIRLRPWRLRWTTPAQLDQLAKQSGLRLTERFADWDESSFSEDSERHVSVYGLAG